MNALRACSCDAGAASTLKSALVKVSFHSVMCVRSKGSDPRNLRNLRKLYIQGETYGRQSHLIAVLFSTVFCSGLTFIRA